MKTILLLLVVSLSETMAVHAQDAHAPDGGNVTRIQSITIPPLSGAPFSAIVSANWSRPLADGNAQALHNSRIVARDSAGRIYQQRRRFVPDRVQGEPPITEIDISDPLTHQLLRCLPAVKECMVLPYYASAAVAPLRPAGALPGNRGYLDRIDLGQNTVSGLEVVGTRETTTYNPGVFGNQTEMKVVKEFWYSPQLDVNLSVHRSDPRYGVEDFVVSDVSLSEPDSSLFHIPQGYRLASVAPANAPQPPHTLQSH